MGSAFDTLDFAPPTGVAGDRTRATHDDMRGGGGVRDRELSDRHSGARVAGDILGEKSEVLVDISIPS